MQPLETLRRATWHWQQSARNAPRSLAGAIGERALTVCAVALLPASVWIAVTTVLGVIAAHHPVPYWDHWEATTDAFEVSRGQYTLGDLWRQHNEHRIAFPRLLFLADSRCFGGSSAFLLACMLAMQVAHCVVLGAAVSWRRPGAWWKVAASAVLIATLLSATQMENFIWGFQVQFTLVYLAATTALVGLAAATTSQRRAPRAALYAIALAAGFVCTHSMANGVLVWPLLVSAALLLHAPWRTWLTIVVVGAASWLSFFRDYTFTAHLWQHGLPSLDSIAFFTLTFLGNPVSEHGIVAAAWAGAAALLLGIAVSTFALCRRPRSARQIALTHVMAFAVGSAVLSAVGRIGRFGLADDTGICSRYGTATLVYWAALALLLLSVCSLRRGWFARGAALVPTAAIVFSLASAQQGGLHQFDERPFTQDQVALSLLMGVRDDEVLAKTVGELRDYLMEQAEKQRQLGLPPFNWSERDWIGRRLRDVVPALVPGCAAGAIEGCERIAGTTTTVRIRGWATGPSGGPSRPRLVLVDEDGFIRGLAAGGWPRPRAPGVVAHDAWRGYCNVVGTRDAPSVAAFLISENHRVAYEVPGTRKLPGTLDALTEIGSLMTSSVTTAVQAGGAWVVDGQHPTTPQLADRRLVYGSWAGSDTNVGRIVFGPFEAGAHRVLVLPVFAGPAGTGMQVSLQWTCGEVIAQRRDLGEAAHAVRWIAWRVELPVDAADAHLELVAEDSGSGWGQWMAVGLPYWVD